MIVETSWVCWYYVSSSNDEFSISNTQCSYTVNVYDEGGWYNTMTYDFGDIIFVPISINGISSYVPQSPTTINISSTLYANADPIKNGFPSIK